MNLPEIEKKEKLSAAERKLSEVSKNAEISMKETLEAYKGVEVARADLEGRVVDCGSFAAFLDRFVIKHSTWFSADDIERAARYNENA